MDWFTMNDITVIGTLVILEGLLSADNALVLAVMVKHLPWEQRGKALRYGIWGAFIFRAIGVILAATLIQYWYLKAIGAGYLLLLATKHFLAKRAQTLHGGAATGVATGFWMTVMYVELADIAFSIDSIVAAVALSDKKIIVYIGGIIGIITMRFVASFFLKLLDGFPRLESAAYILVGWIGLKLAVESIAQGWMGGIDGPAHVIPPWLFWSVMGVVFFSAFVPGRRSANTEEVQRAQDQTAVLALDPTRSDTARPAPGTAH